MLRVVVAPDSLKGSLSAERAALALAAGWTSVRPGDRLELLPQADGGEGTLDAMQAAVPDARRRTLTVTGPDGRPVAADWLLLPGGEAVVEFAQSSGLPLMREPDALGATSFGLGEVIVAALREADSLVIGLGGSATTDGAAGALQALGMVLRDAEGAELGRGGGALAALASVDRTSLLAPPGGGVRLLTDVTNPLLGPSGAAATFAPQKGAGATEVALLEGALTRWAAVLGGDPRAAGTGAAGGAAFGFASAWGAELVPGSAEIARLTGLESALRDADVLITGEGRFDATSLAGKVVGHGLEVAPEPVRAIVVAGQTASQPAPAGADLITLSDLAGSLSAAMSDPERWLRAAGARAAATHVERRPPAS
ncbi:MAG: glycerate kinase [Pseudolysinimonas sp.]